VTKYTSILVLTVSLLAPVSRAALAASEAAGALPDEQTEAGSSGDVAEIIVTAQKREESSPTSQTSFQD
jgi:hypothetical protein